MAVYSAVVSFEQLLKQLLNSDQFPKEDLASLHAKISSLQSSLAKIFPTPKSKRRKANDLANQIRDEIFEAQDKIETFIFSQSHPSESQETSKGQSSTSISLEKIIKNIDPFIKAAETLADSIRKGKKDSPAGVEPETFKSSSSGQSTRIVGQEKDKRLLNNQLLDGDDKREIIPITGMAGIGKTTLAKSLYEDAAVMNQFPFRAWVTVSQDYHVVDILAKLLSSVESRGQKAGDKVSQGTEEQLRLQLHQTLYNNRYLIVIDDLWEQEVWGKLELSLPDNRNGSRVLLTTRLLNVANSVKSSKFCHEMQPLNDEDSWFLLCERTFGGMHCPRHLEKVGKDIANNCRGLPLSITVIGGLLSQGRKEEDYWRSIEEDTYAATFDAKLEDCHKRSLSLSYDHLPIMLKGCFLYMAAFPKDSEILVSKLIKLLVAEGFLAPPSPPQTIEQVAEKSLEELCHRNIIFVHKYSSDGRIKTCGVYNSLHELAEEEAGNEKFLHSRKKYAQKLEEGLPSQRRVSIHETVLMCQKDVYQLTKSIELARSLLYVDPSYPHPLPFLLTFDLLRVLDAHTVFFIEFPHEVIKLIHLRYLSFTYNGKLPSSLSKLKNLQILMVRRIPKIIVVGISFLPMEIWNMPQLRHLQFTESDLPRPSCPDIPEHNSVLFENLQSLSNVSSVSCTREVLRNMPNLKKLGMWIEEPGTVGFYLDELNQLDAFKFTVLKPIPGSMIYCHPKLSFPKTLRKLSLSGCGLPWEDTEIIGKLPNLEVLKLRELAFQGEKWCLEDYTFEKLKFLLIEYLDFKHWEADSSHFPRLERLIIRHCYELEGIPLAIGEGGYLELIELVDCSLPAGQSAEDIRDEQESFGNERLQVRIESSWE